MLDYSHFVTGEKESLRPASMEETVKLKDLGVEKCFIAFMERFGGHNVYNPYRYIGKRMEGQGYETWIHFFLTLSESLRNKEDYCFEQPNAFEHCLQFACGGSTYDWYVYMTSGPQKDQVFYITANHTQLSQKGDSFDVDGHIVVHLADSFEEFSMGLESYDISVRDGVRIVSELYLTEVGEERNSVIVFLKKQQRLKTLSEARALLGDLPINLGRSIFLKEDLEKLGCTYEIRSYKKEL